MDQLKEMALQNTVYRCLEFRLRHHTSRVSPGPQDFSRFRRKAWNGQDNLSTDVISEGHAKGML